MADQVKGTEEFFLKIVKHAILALMGLSLVVIPVLLVIGAVNFMSQPKVPEQAKKAPDKEVTMDGMQQYLLELQKRDDEREKLEKSDPSKKKISEQDLQQARYLGDAVKMHTCSINFAAAVDAEIDARRDQKAAQADELVEISKRIETSANKPGRGGPYVKSLVNFHCKALADPGVIALRKTGKFKGKVNASVLSYHEAAWDAIVAARQEFEANEQNRVTSERMAEVARIAADRVRAVAALTGAGSAFAVFMLLAIYLILAKIETNMRDINMSIRTREEQVAS